MLSLDLFDSRYEKKLHEGAVDDLEQHRIDVLNDRMQELLARARTADPALKASLRQQFEKIKSERDSYYKIREAQKGQDIVDRTAKMKAVTPAKPGVAGAIKDVAKGLKNFLQGRPETGPTYEAQKKSLDLSKGVIPTEPLPEHGGGIGPKQRWQDLMPEGNMEEAKQITTPDEFLDARAHLLRKLEIEPNPANKQILRAEIRKLEGQAEAEGWLTLQQRLVREQSSTSSDAAEQAIIKRIMVAHTDLLKNYGPQKVMQAVEEVVYNIGDLGEIGTSDVSGWVHQVEQILGARA